MLLSFLCFQAVHLTVHDKYFLVFSGDKPLDMHASYFLYMPNILVFIFLDNLVIEDT